MPRARPEPWDEEQADTARQLMMKFCGDPETLCAYMECSKADLTWLCRKAYGLSYPEARAKYELKGKAILRMAYYDAAVDDKNSKALDLLSREHLGMLGPVERRRKAATDARQAAEETDF